MLHTKLSYKLFIIQPFDKALNSRKEKRSPPHRDGFVTNRFLILELFKPEIKHLFNIKNLSKKHQKHHNKLNRTVLKLITRAE